MSPAQYQRFVDITLGDEDNRDSRNFVIRWESDVRLQVSGQPSDEDLRQLQGIVADLSDLLPSISISVVKRDGNFSVHYAPIESYGERIRSWGVEPGDLSTACAIFFYWRRGGEIEEVRVLLPTNAAQHGCGPAAGTDYALSTSLEEITQGFGFPTDVVGESDSIFDQYADPAAYSESDRTLIRSLYCSGITGGMTEKLLWPILVSESARGSDLLRRAGVEPMSNSEVIALRTLLADLGYKVGASAGELDQTTLAAAAAARSRFWK